MFNIRIVSALCKPMRLKLISCEVFYREMAAASARSPNHIEVEFLPARLHKGHCAVLRRRMQNSIHRAARARFHAVLLGYGLCSLELAGLLAGSIPLVIPRKCDCISRLLGRGSGPETAFQGCEMNQPSQDFGSRFGRNTLVKPRPLSKKFRCGFDHLAAHYGDEVAEYFYTEFGHRNEGYNPLKFVEINTGSESGRYSRFPASNTSTARSIYLEQPQTSLIQRLVDGYWSYEQFLVVPPGWEVVPGVEQGLTAVQHTP